MSEETDAKLLSPDEFKRKREELIRKSVSEATSHPTDERRAQEMSDAEYAKACSAYGYNKPRGYGR